MSLSISISRNGAAYSRVDAGTTPFALVSTGHVPVASLLCSGASYNAWCGSLLTEKQISLGGETPGPCSFEGSSACASFPGLGLGLDPGTLHVVFWFVVVVLDVNQGRGAPRNELRQASSLGGRCIRAMDSGSGCGYGCTVLTNC